MSEGTQSTIAMIRQAYPAGVPDALVHPLARALYEHMSDRQLAATLSVLSGEDPAVAINKVYEAAAMEWEHPTVQSVVAVLRTHGYDDWCDE